MNTINKEFIKDKVLLVTGGTGSFGKNFVNTALREYQPRKIIIFSRDELKQYEMSHQYNADDMEIIRFFIGDVRDRERLYRALDGVDIVVHAAALKQVPACEYNPIEAVKTNILGAANIIDAAIDRGVEKVVALSTDKAANPINLYGATKLCSDKLFVAANAYSGAHKTKFSVVRYGNVLGSRGSVIPLFRRLKESGRIPITDRRMTRFWITLKQGVNFVFRSLEVMQGGEIYVPKIPSSDIEMVAQVIAPGCEIEEIGIRPGEKLHEVLISKDDARNSLEFEDRYAILPSWVTVDIDKYQAKVGGTPCRPDFEYSSDANPETLDEDGLKRLIETADAESQALATR